MTTWLISGSQISEASSSMRGRSRCSARKHSAQARMVSPAGPRTRAGKVAPGCAQKPQHTASPFAASARGATSRAVSIEADNIRACSFIATYRPHRRRSQRRRPGWPGHAEAFAGALRRRSSQNKALAPQAGAAASTNRRSGVHSAATMVNSNWRDTLPCVAATIPATT